jgi:polar amino acid transport system substrate-binding protein
MTVRLVADPYPPYQFEEEGNVKGIDHDVIVAAFAESAMAVETQLLPWQECIERMQRRWADGIFQIVRSSEREGQFLFSHPLRTAKTAFFSSDDRHISFDKDRDLTSQISNLKLGVLTGYSYVPQVDDLSEDIKIFVDSQEMLLHGLFKRKFDLMIMDVGVARYLQSRMNFSGIEQDEDCVFSRNLYVAFQKDSGDLVEKFNRGLEVIKRDGRYTKILRRYIDRAP